MADLSLVDNRRISSVVAVLGTGISDLSAYLYSRAFAAFRSNEVLAQPETLYCNSPSESLAESADPRCNPEALYSAKWV